VNRESLRAEAITRRHPRFYFFGSTVNGSESHIDRLCRIPIAVLSGEGAFDGCSGGTFEISPAFQRRERCSHLNKSRRDGWRMANRPFRDFDDLFNHLPTLKHWAIFECPFGTSRQPASIERRQYAYGGIALTSRILRGIALQSNRCLPRSRGIG
jgi:hypothetical protein